MNSLAGEGVDVETINYVDLLFERLQGREGLGEGHGGALAFGAPVVFVNAISQEDDAKTLGEGGGWGDIRQGVEGLKPGQGHRAAGSAEYGSAGYGAGGVVGW